MLRMSCSHISNDPYHIASAPCGPSPPLRIKKAMSCHIIMIVENSFIGMLLPFEYSSSRPWKAGKLALYSIGFRREDDVLAEVSR